MTPHGDTPADLFDSHGLFRGQAGARFAEQMCRAVEERVDGDGWDQPARLFAIASPVATEHITGIDAATLVRLHQEASDTPDPGHERDADPDEEHAEETFSTTYALIPLGEIHGHPAEEMWGQEAPDWAAAVILVFEGWAAPPEVRSGEAADPHPGLAPSARPDRIEYRGTHMITRAGAEYTLSRHRGSDPEFHTEGDAADATGFLADTLRRTLAVPTSAPPSDAVGDYLGRIVLSSAINAVAVLTGETPPPGTAGPGAEAMTADLTDQLATLTAQERSDVYTTAYAATMLTTIATLTWNVANHGKGPEVTIDLPLRKSFRAAVATPPTERDTLRTVLETAQRCADLTFTDLTNLRRAHTVLPARVSSLPTGWADDGLLWRACIRQFPTQEQLLDEAIDRHGIDRHQIESILAGANWLRRP